MDAVCDVAVRAQARRCARDSQRRTGGRVAAGLLAALDVLIVNAIEAAALAVALGIAGDAGRIRGGAASATARPHRDPRRARCARRR
jgi:hypothetical protein